MTLMPEVEERAIKVETSESTDLVPASPLSPDEIRNYESRIDKDFVDATAMWRVDGITGDADKSPYADWTGVLRFVMSEHMQTPDDFFPSAVIEDADVRDLLVQLVALGRRQFHAFVNNRMAIVESLNDEISILLKYKNGSDSELDVDAFDAMVRTTLIYIQTLPAEDRASRLEDLIKERRNRLAYIHASMEKDKAEGHFQDYTDAKRRVAAGEADYTTVLDEMPYFLQEAHAIAKSTETNTRRRHFQAVIARLLDTVTGQSQKDQRGLQSMWRSNRGGNNGEYDFGEENF